jgi:hypothetical protein
MKKIAALVFIPNQEHLIQQFFSLYYSVMLHPTLRNEIDFIIGCAPEITDLFNQENCVVVHTREISKEAEFQFHHRKHEYGYINSWSHFISQESVDVILSYPYALRIDVDTFISPSILSIELSDAEILVGQGGYIGGEETTDNLLRVAAKLGLTHRGQHNLGSTWYTRSDIMIEMGQSALACAQYILKNEFVEEDGEWPRWYGGVTSLYAGELALNHSPYSVTVTKKLDADSTSGNNIEDVYTVHAWHTDQFFSKHAFIAGKYEDRSQAYEFKRAYDYAFLCSQSGKLLANAAQQASGKQGAMVQPFVESRLLTPVQALRMASNLLKQAIPKAPKYILQRLFQKLSTRSK